MSRVADRVKSIPRPEEPIGLLVWPTLALFAFAIVIFVGSTVLGVASAWPWPVSTLVNSAAGFMLFTVTHEASHAAASSNERLNLWLGRISTPVFMVYGSFKPFRFIHMQHHRFTNHSDGADPDYYVSKGPRWQRPLRWLTLDMSYQRLYFARRRERPRAELREGNVMMALALVFIAALVATGHAFAVLAYWLLPSRITGLLLAWSFDYLPHHGLRDLPTTNRFRTTRNRIGLEAVLTPLLLYQNYHLVHHLHPTIPFYRYLAVWRRNEDAYLANDPALTTVGGRALTVDEYRRLRELDVEHA